MLLLLVVVVVVVVVVIVLLLVLHLSPPRPHQLAGQGQYRRLRARGTARGRLPPRTTIVIITIIVNQFIIIITIVMIMIIIMASIHIVSMITITIIQLLVVLLFTLTHTLLFTTISSPRIGPRPAAAEGQGKILHTINHNNEHPLDNATEHPR